MTPIVNFAPEAVSLWAMLGGGLLAFVSPCVLPMLPMLTMQKRHTHHPIPAMKCQ